LVIFLIPHTISFLYSYKCNFECAHCSVNGGPWHTQVLEIDTIIKTLDDAYDIPSIQVVVLTGGEPTLYPKHLKTTISYAYKLGFTVRMVTNAWWVRSYEEAKEFLHELYSCGLRELNISYDDFHLPWLKKFGGESNIINAARAGADIGMKVLIATTKDKNSAISTKYIKELLMKEELLGRVEFLEDFIAPIGRGKYLTSVKNLSNNGCIDTGNVLTIHPDGKVVVCCGHIFSTEAVEILTAGNIKTDSLKDIIARIHKNVLYWWIFLRGPQEILWKLSDESIVHKCEACYLLGTKYRNKLALLASKKEYIFNALKRWEDVRV